MLRMLIQGSTMKEVGEFFGINRKAASARAGIIRQKLECKTMYEVIAKVVKENLVKV